MKMFIGRIDKMGDFKISILIELGLHSFFLFFGIKLYCAKKFKMSTFGGSSIGG
jgi:hypothetical protein